METSGARQYEISIEVPSHRPRALGLTLQDVANAVRRGSLELSADSIDTRDSRVRVRTLGQRYNQQDFEDIVVLSRGDGTVARLRDIAAVHDEFQAIDPIIRHQNQPGEPSMSQLQSSAGREDRRKGNHLPHTGFDRTAFR